MLKKLFQSICITYIVSFIILIICGLIMFYGHVEDKGVSVMIIITYFVSNLMGGICIGKSVDSRRFLWGLIVGILYFAILCCLSIVGKGIENAFSSSMVIGLFTCMFGGMIGGMLS